MISILLATYNGERYLKYSIDSVLNQTFKDFELLIGFNGTTDNSREIVKKYNDSRIRIFDYENDKGKANTLNKLIKEAKYDWIAIQDDDDCWLPNKLEKQIKNINNFDAIGTQISYIDERGNIIGEVNLSISDDYIKKISMCGSNQIANTSAIFKKSDAIQIGGWRQEFDGIEDYDFWLRLMRIGKKFININERLVLHRQHTNSKFNTKTYNISRIL